MLFDVDDVVGGIEGRVVCLGTSMYEVSNSRRRDR
jgi:hypothetical protein